MDFIEYDPAYPRVFSELVRIIQSVLPDARVEHVGSTSVPGLGGRGAVDAVVVSDPADRARMVQALKGIGFTDFPYGAAQPALTYRLHLDGQDYFILLYFLPPEHEYVKGWLAFREFMRGHPEQIEQYAQIKKAAIAAGKTQPWSYQQAKTPYLEELWRRIEASSNG